MAFTFKEGKMASNQLDSMLTNGVADVEIKDGSLVVIGEPKTFAYEESGVEYPEYDTYAISLAAAATDKVAIVDYAGIQEVGDENYKMGIKLYNLKVPAGYPTRIRRLALHDKFWLGSDNFNAEPTEGQYAVAGANGLHVPSASAASNYCVKIIAKREFTIGMKSDKNLYLVEVISL